MSSLAVGWVAVQKALGANLALTVIEQLPVLQLTLCSSKRA